MKLAGKVVMNNDIHLLADGEERNILAQHFVWVHLREQFGLYSVKICESSLITTMNICVAQYQENSAMLNHKAVCEIRDCYKEF
jgi:hypothetical protein